MQDKSHYTNGQKIFEQKGDVLMYFYKNGNSLGVIHLTPKVQKI